MFQLSFKIICYEYQGMNKKINNMNNILYFKYPSEIAVMLDCFGIKYIEKKSPSLFWIIVCLFYDGKQNLEEITGALRRNISLGIRLNVICFNNCLNEITNIKIENMIFVSSWIILYCSSIKNQSNVMTYIIY